MDTWLTTLGLEFHSVVSHYCTGLWHISGPWSVRLWLGCLFSFYASAFQYFGKWNGHTFKLAANFDNVQSTDEPINFFILQCFVFSGFFVLSMFFWRDLAFDQDCTCSSPLKTQNLERGRPAPQRKIRPGLPRRRACQDPVVMTEEERVRGAAKASMTDMRKEDS